MRRRMSGESLPRNDGVLLPLRDSCLFSLHSPLRSKGDGRVCAATLYSHPYPWYHLPMQATIRALIFDLDGTLVNSLVDLADSANAVLAAAGYPIHPADAYRHFVGSGLERLMRRALPGGESAPHDAATLDPLLAAMRATYDARWHEKSRPYPGISELLAALTHLNFPLAVLSNKPDPWTQAFVSHFFPSTPFAVVRGALPGIPHKPDPASALDVAARLGVEPRHCLFVGDSNVDVRTGLNAGMAVAGVTWGFRDEAELRAAGATWLVHAPQDLLQGLA